MPKDRIQLAKYFAELGFKRGVEVGVCTGRYSKILCENIPGLQLLGIDPYISDKGHSYFRDQSKHNSNLDLAREALAPYPNFVLAIAFSHDVAQFIADESLDFVFIDGDHAYESVKQDINDWFPKVRKGGIVSGHDYYLFRSGRGGIVQAVDEFAAQHGYQVTSTGWTKDAHQDDKQPDWWIKK